jgi:hypothetical protein
MKNPNIKKLIYGAAMLLIVVFTAQSCQKVNNLNSQQIIASKTTITATYLDSLTVSNTTTADSIVWSISPATGFNLFHYTNKAFVRFTQAGTFTVTAVVNGGPPLTLAIVVNAAPTPPADTTTTPPHNVPLTNDQISLTAYFHKGPIADSSYIYFTAKTVAMHSCTNSILQVTNSLSSTNSFNIAFIDIFQPATCNTFTGNITARNYITFTQNLSNPYMANGTYPLTATLNGTTYTGSITVSSTTVDISWSYSAGVLISPLHFAR